MSALIFAIFFWLAALSCLISSSLPLFFSSIRAYGLQPVNPRSSQAVSSLLNDPRVASIRARAASGAITRQQAAQALQSLK